MQRRLNDQIIHKCLLAAHAGLAHEPGELGLLAAKKLREGLRRATMRFERDGSKPVAHLGSLQQLVDLGIQSRDDHGGRRSGHPPRCGLQIREIPTLPVPLITKQYTSCA